MAENGDLTLRLLELRLLHCSIPSEHSTSPSHLSPPVSQIQTLLNDVVALIESGEYIQAISIAHTILLDFKFDSSVSAERFFTEILPDCVSFFLFDNCGDGELGYRSLLVMAVGVAALLAFAQWNITGPLDKLPHMSILELWTGKDKREGFDRTPWEEWARTELMSVGSDLRGKFSNLQYFIFAKTLLLRTKDLLFERSVSTTDGVRSIAWWLARVLFLQQRLLNERSSNIFNLLQVLKQELLLSLGTSTKIEEYWGANEDCSTTLAMLHLEVGILELYYGRVDTSTLHLESAAEISKYNFYVTGALGFRTVHQEEPKAQLRLVAATDGGDACTQSGYKSSSTDDSLLHQSQDSDEVSDILMNPRFVDERSFKSDKPISASHLTAMHQVMALAQCSAVEKEARSDELQNWKMAPYIEAVTAQSSSSFIIQYCCSIQRVRWEAKRSKTQQRALLIMDKLVQGISDPSPSVAQRMFYSFGVNIPTISALRKEFAAQLVSCGLIGEALKIYEDLELWDNLIHCYTLIDKKTAAIQLINTRLAESPSDPRLWCSFGDVTNNDTHYEKALEVSGNKSARAFASLARSAYNRKDYEKSKLLWESVMNLNSMYPNGWFALGSAALKSRDIDRSLDAFTRTIQLDPENGEAWNNIACLHMMKNRSKEAFIAFKEALKLKRDSWQMWENFSSVSVDIGNFSQAMEAILKVLEMTKNERVDFEVLERIMVEIEKRVSDESEKRKNEQLIQLLGQILKRIVQKGGNGESWGLYARWHRLKGDLTMCSEARLKQVRSYQGSDLWNDKNRFVKFVHASLELCRVYQLIALSAKSRKELFSAEMHLKSSIKQAVSFVETEEYRDLVNCLDEVQGSIKALSLTNA